MNFILCTAHVDYCVILCILRHICVHTYVLEFSELLFWNESYTCNEEVNISLVSYFRGCPYCMVSSKNYQNVIWNLFLICLKFLKTPFLCGANSSGRFGWGCTRVGFQIFQNFFQIMPKLQRFWNQKKPKFYENYKWRLGLV